MVVAIYEKINSKKSDFDLAINIGTATLISKNYAVSCAHNFAHPKFKGYQLVTAVFVLTDK